MGYVYLIHFEKPVNGARHYTGYTDSFEQRIAQHRAGEGSELTKAAKEQGINWLVVRVWRGMTYQDERLLKSFMVKGMCPVCKQKEKDIETYKKRGTSRPRAEPKLATAKPSETLSR